MHFKGVDHVGRFVWPCLCAEVAPHEARDAETVHFKEGIGAYDGGLKLPCLCVNLTCHAETMHFDG